MPKKVIYLVGGVIVALLIFGYIYKNYFIGTPMGEITKINKPHVYNPKVSITYNSPYSKLESELLYSRLTTPKIWVDKQGNKNQDGHITIRLNRNKKQLVNLVRELDKLVATKPQIIKLNYEDVKPYVLTIWREGTSVSFVLLKANSKYYLGSTIHYYQKPGQFVLKVIPEKVLKLMGFQD